MKYHNVIIKYNINYHIYAYSIIYALWLRLRIKFLIVKSESGGLHWSSLAR